ncbi:MAG: type II secretion system F family protein [Candidatus Aenigmarchaeota archaeon]|nr:type II secretion system F family protein [Candidatus Aenigmarchaeota archaeon]
MYRFLYAISPVRYRKWVEKHIDYCDFTVSPIRLIGFLILFGIVASFAVSFLLFSLKLLTFQAFLLAWAIGFAGFEVLGHLMLIFIADSRSNFVEQILPDALQIISSNMRSGLTPDKAILTSARPEFGPLEKELRKAAEEALSGKSFEEALSGISTKIKSKILDKTVSLIIEGLIKGGSITSLLDSVADDIRQARILRDEIRSYVMMYGIFIFFAVGIGAPLLYSVSTYLVQTMAKLGGAVDLQTLVTNSAIPLLRFKPAEISTDFLRMYSYISIFITALFGSMLIGLIQDGSEKNGLKLFPVLLGIGLAVFILSQIALKAIFGTIIA